MCGIAGIIGVNPDTAKDRMGQMLQLLERRGPDAQAMWQDGNTTLGHTRLSIIDLTAAANQPFIDKETGNVLIFNGEVYNFLDLKKELQAAGIRFKTNSDTEVLLKAFSLWGMEKTLTKAEGMYAFTIYQPAEKKLYLARDRFGQKPLYICQEDQEILFSSEMNALKKACRSQLTVNYEVLGYYFKEYAIPQPHTIYKEVKQLPPASYLVIDTENIEATEPISYWSLKPKVNEGLREQEVLEKTERLLAEAVVKREVSDVPLGFFLSGGIDSSLMVSMASEYGKKKVSTFSVGFDHDYHNELPQARQLANQFGTDHHEIVLTPDIAKMAIDISRYTGEPFADYSLIPSAYICQAIRKEATVAISGDGGDEMFGGYKNYVDLYRANWLKSKFGAMAGQAINATKLLSRINKTMPNLGMAKKFLNQQSPDFVTLRDSGLASHMERGKVFHDAFNPDFGFADRYFDKLWSENNTDLDTGNNQQYVSLTTLLLNDFLVKIDRASMYSSLEVRSPFLDHHLAEFAFTIPASLKFKGLHSKYILKKLLNRKLSRNVFKEPKRGFTIPIGQWLKGALAPWAESILLDGLKQRQIFDENYLVKMWNEHKQGVRDYRDFLWILIALEIWFQECHDKTG